MFRGLSGIIEKREKSFVKVDEGGSKVNNAFVRFLDECFPEGKNFKYQISYNAASNRIIIETLNKTIANELILKINNLPRFLQKESITVRQVVIR